MINPLIKESINQTISQSTTDQTTHQMITASLKASRMRAPFDNRQPLFVGLVEIATFPVRTDPH
jgi:hypothetical protein